MAFRTASLHAFWRQVPTTRQAAAIVEEREVGFDLYEANRAAVLLCLMGLAGVVDADGAAQTVVR